MIDYDPFDRATQEDPYPIYQELRTHAPIYHNARRDFYALSLHEDIRTALRTPATYSSAHGNTLDPRVWGPNASTLLSVVAMDAPAHTRIRTLVSAGFTPRRVSSLEAAVHRLTARELEPHLEAGHFDFVSAVADIPVHVIAELIGIPFEDRGELLRMSNLMIEQREDPDDMKRLAPTLLRVLGYFQELINERRRRPQDDLTSALAEAVDQGTRFTDQEIIALLGLLNVAGNESTTKLMANAWYQAWRHPDQQKIAWDGGIGAWVEETLRFDNSAQLLARLLREPVELHGVTIPQGARIALLIASANRDEQAFDRAGSYDLTRDTSNAIPFGTGLHFCIGAALARLTTRVVLSELVARVAAYDVDLDKATYVHSTSLRGFASLPTSVQHR